MTSSYGQRAASWIGRLGLEGKPTSSWRFSLADLLLRRSFGETQFQTNPFITRIAERQAAITWRNAILLFVFGLLISAAPLFIPSSGDLVSAILASQKAVTQFDDAGAVTGVRYQQPVFPLEMGMSDVDLVLIVLLAFVMNRYFLYIGRSTQLIRQLRAQNLSSLFETPMQSEDYFLVPFLFFWSKIRQAAGLLAIPLIMILAVQAIADLSFISSPRVLAPVVLYGMLLALLMIGVAAQHVFEWQMFAGRRNRIWHGMLQPVVSMLVSAVGAWLSLYCYYFVVRGQYVAGLCLSAAFLLVFGWIVAGAAIETNSTALATLMLRADKLSRNT